MGWSFEERISKDLQSSRDPSPNSLDNDISHRGHPFSRLSIVPVVRTWGQDRTVRESERPKVTETDVPSLHHRGGASSDSPNSLTHSTGDISRLGPSAVSPYKWFPQDTGYDVCRETKLKVGDQLAKLCKTDLGREQWFVRLEHVKGGPKVG